MSYDWDKIAKTLAVEVMGWEIKKSEHYPERIRQLVDDDGVIIYKTSDSNFPGRPSGFWQPHKNLNQAWRLLDLDRWHGCLDWSKSGTEVTMFWVDSDKTEEDERGRGMPCASHSMDDNAPALTICLAVLKAIGEDISDYEED